jgi:hypothetical protein
MLQTVFVQPNQSVLKPYDQFQTVSRNVLPEQHSFQPAFLKKEHEQLDQLPDYTGQAGH